MKHPRALSVRRTLIVLYADQCSLDAPTICRMVGIREDDRIAQNLIRDIILMPVLINPMAPNLLEGAPKIRIGDDVGRVTHPA